MRGDAIAGILILLINMVGGMLIGVMEHDMTAGGAAKAYVMLTIGDGLVAQIPALVISIAAGLVVSRVGNDGDVGGQVIGQLFGDPRVLGISAGIMGLMGMIPGMPNFVFLLIAAGLGYLAWHGVQKAASPKVKEAAEKKAAEQAAAQSVTPPEQQEAAWTDVVPVDTLGLEVGYRLIPLVDRGQDGELLKRIRGLRKKFAAEIGFLTAPVHIRDNLELKPNGYRITLKGVDVGSGEAYPGSLMAINPGRVAGSLPGREARDPAFGLPAVWIEQGLREQAHALGYTVVDAATVIATHLNHLILTHAAELFGRQEAQALLEHVGREQPKLVEDLVPKALPLAVVQRVLQSLLEEGVAIRDMRSIVETLAEYAPRTQDPLELTSRVRVALGRAIVQQLFPGNTDVR